MTLLFRKLLVVALALGFCFVLAILFNVVWALL